MPIVAGSSEVGSGIAIASLVLVPAFLFASPSHTFLQGSTTPKTTYYKHSSLSAALRPSRIVFTEPSNRARIILVLWRRQFHAIKPAAAPPRRIIDQEQPRQFEPPSGPRTLF